jgi:tripartite ATP-independent transporter DctP family solute receptor
MKAVKKGIIIGLLLLGVFGFNALGGVDAAPKPIVMRIAHAQPTTHSFQLWAVKFKEELQKRIGNQIDVQIFPNSQLGRETEYLEQMKMGTLNGCIVGRHSQIDERLDVLNLPFIYRNDAHMDAVLRKNAPIGKKLNKILLEHGFVCFGWGELGFRYITTKDRPVRKASDLKGLDIRIPNNPSWIAAFKDWGANPTPIDFSELYSALQQGVVKAEENPPEIIYTSKFFEVQKYLCLTDHANMPCEFLVSQAFMSKLPKKITNAMMAAAKIARDYQVKITRQANREMLNELEKSGMTIIRDVDKKSFLSGADKAYQYFAKKWGTDLINGIKEVK